MSGVFKCVGCLAACTLVMHIADNEGVPSPLEVICEYGPGAEWVEV